MFTPATLRKHFPSISPLWGPQPAAAGALRGLFRLLAGLLLLQSYAHPAGFGTAATNWPGFITPPNSESPYHYLRPRTTAPSPDPLSLETYPLDFQRHACGGFIHSYPAAPAVEGFLSAEGLLLGAGAAALLLSFRALLAATRPVEAIFSFLLLLLSLLPPLLLLEADYVGAIHLMVYPGAILIFFSFATLTTDQLGHWDQPSLGGRAGLARGGLRARLEAQLPTLLVALPLLLLWWKPLQPRLGPSVQSRMLQPDHSSLAGSELLRSSDLVALGLEIFQRRLLSLTLLGLLLLLAFLTALELLAPLRRRRSSSLFPRLGALVLVQGLGVPLKGSTPHWNQFGGDAWLLPLLPLLALGLGALATRRYAFLHSFLLLEALGLLLNLFFVVVGTAADDLGGSVLVLFTVAVAAAETAVGLALFLALSQGSAAAAPAALDRSGTFGRRRWAVPPPSRRRRV